MTFLSENAINGPILTERVVISPKRLINLKLWPPSSNSRCGSSKSSIELQEARRSEENQWEYSSAIRISCDASTALLVNLMSYFLIEERKLNHEFKNNMKSYNPEEKKVTYELNSNSKELDIETILLSNFKNIKLSKTRIITSLSEKGFNIDKSSLMTTLEHLATENKISKESAIHSASGNHYILWGFPS